MGPCGLHALFEDTRLLADELKTIYRDLSRAVGGLRFAPPTACVYNPLEYARGPAEQYLKLAAGNRGRVMLLGMNPGPWGMAQTGVPFGAVTPVRDWLGIGGRVGKPADEHPKRPVLGFGVEREEVSGSRLWGWARERFGSPDRFFERFFVANYCPLVFMEPSGRNRTPDRLPEAEKRALFRHCDRALLRLVSVLAPAWVVGVGHFAETRARAALDGTDMRIGRILHPSPASPAANRGWSRQVEAQLAGLGIDLAD
jgi:single-strand selective monofunctional uracil DNA glycosylase